MISDVQVTLVRKLYSTLIGGTSPYISGFALPMPDVLRVLGKQYLWPFPVASAIDSVMYWQDGLGLLGATHIRLVT